ITRFAWTLPGASPAVGPAKSRERIRSRSRLPASTLRSDPRSIVWFLISNSTADWTRAPSYAELAARHSAGGWITYRWRRWFARRGRHRLRRLGDRARAGGGPAGGRGRIRGGGGGGGPGPEAGGEAGGDNS